MNLEEFEGSLAEPPPSYLVKQGQTFVLDRVRRLVLAQVPEAARTFDWAEFDLKGSHTELDVVSTAQTLPWVSPRRWLWIRSAQESGDGLLQYLRSPSTRSVLILEFSGRKPTKWPRIPLIELQETDPVRWLIERAQERGYQLKRSAVSELVELVGEDLPRLDSELEKLMLYRLDESKISRKDVLELCRQTRESEIFDLIASLASRRAQQALLISDRLFESGIRLPQILGILYWNFRRLIVARELMQARRPFIEIVKELKLWSYRNQKKTLEGLPRKRLIELLLKLKNLEVRFKTETVHEKETLEAFLVDACLKKSL